MDLSTLLFMWLRIFLEAIYYTGWFFFVFYEVWVASNPAKFIRYTDVLHSDNLYAVTSEERKKSKRILTILNWYCVWTIIGIFSDHWHVPVAIFILSAGGAIFLNKTSRSETFERWDAILCGLLILFMLINKFHLELF